MNLKSFQLYLFHVFSVGVRFFFHSNKAFPIFESEEFFCWVLVKKSTRTPTEAKRCESWLNSMGSSMSPCCAAPNPSGNFQIMIINHLDYTYREK